MLKREGALIGMGLNVIDKKTGQCFAIIILLCIFAVQTEKDIKIVINCKVVLWYRMDDAYNAVLLWNGMTII